MKKSLSLVLLASLGFVCAPDVRAIPVLTLTEVNSTTLDWSWSTGQHGVLPNTAADKWADSSITGPTVTLGDVAAGTWAEPDNPVDSLNAVTVAETSAGVFSVRGVLSDAPGPPGTANGVPVTSQNGSYQVVWVDNGDSGSVPDSGSTLLLLTLGLVGVGLLRVKSKARILQVCG